MFAASRARSTFRRARDLFDKIPNRAPTSKFPTFSSHLSSGDHPILHLFDKAKTHPNLDLNVLHAHAVVSGHILDPFAASRVLDLFLHSHSVALHRAVSVFDSIRRPDIYSWNAMLAGHIARGCPEGCAAFYFRMRACRVPPNGYTFALLVKACILAGLGEGRAKEVHGQVLKCGADGVLVVKNSLLSMYCNMGRLDDAEVLFDNGYGLDLISWNTMISAHGKGGDVDHARDLFDEMPKRNLVSWSAMIDAYIQSGDFTEALRLFRQMQSEGMRPDVVVLVSVLKACAHLGALAQGRWIHLYIDRNELGNNGNVILSTALIDMYSKCGCVDAAMKVFDAVQCTGDVVLWNAMIGGLAMNGLGTDSISLFRRMKAQDKRPNATTFIGVLRACAHAGMVDEGVEIFESMKEHNIEPQREHYGCLADVLARAGQVEEAERVLLNMPMEPEASQWGALLSACRTHNSIVVGERVGKRLIALEPFDGGRYVLLANLYANAGRWQEARDTRRAMEAKGIKKEIGCSFVEWNGSVHEFFVGSILNHPQNREIFAKLDEMEKQLEMAGYVKDTSQLLVEMEDEEEKGMALSYHSEKLAIAFCLMNISHGEVPIRIVKNLRVCRDCHTYTKLVSKVYQRELIVRDRNRFHRFVDGSCSCNDFW